jgi:hypothetical protein
MSVPKMSPIMNTLAKLVKAVALYTITSKTVTSKKSRRQQMRLWPKFGLIILDYLMAIL